MNKKALGLLGPLRDKDAGPLALAAALLLAFAIWHVALFTVEGLLGWLFDFINVTNKSGSFRLAFGKVVQIVLTAALALFIMLFFLKGGSPVEDLKEAMKGEERKPESKEAPAA